MTVDNMTRLNGKTAVITGGVTSEPIEYTVIGERLPPLGLRQGRWLAPDELVTNTAIS